jgi:DHA1 family bicyclomycin/chloramphenicol resistance-like MFS transporter
MLAAVAMGGEAAAPVASPTRRVVAAVALVGLSGAWNGGNVGPVASQIGDEFDVSLAAVGLLSGTIFMGATVVGLLFAAQLGDRLGMLRGLRFATSLLVVGNLIFALSPAFGGLAIARAFPGLGFALINVLGGVYARQAGGVRLIGVFGAAIQLGIAGGLVVGSVLVDAGIDWRVGFLVSALLAVLTLAVLPRTETPGSELPKREPGFLRAAISHARVWRLALLFVSIYGVPLTLSAWMVEYLVQDGDVKTGIAGVLSFLLFGLAAAMRIAGARLQQRGARHVVLAGALGFAALGLVVLAVDPSIEFALIAVIAMGVGFAIPYATMMTEAQQLFPDAPSEPLALMTLAALIPPIFAIPLVGQALDDGNGGAAMLALAAFLVVATLLNLRRSGIPLRASARAA